MFINALRIELKELSTHELCIRDMREEFIDCEGPAAWYEKTDHEAVCQYVLRFKN